LLLIACANLAGLFLARNVSRRQEIGIRLSIGAGKQRIVRQLMTESLLLSLTGCVMALPVSFLARNFLAGYYSMDSEGFAHTYDLALDWRVLLFCVGLGTATGLLFGLGPALRATRDDLITQIKGSGSSLEMRGRWRQILVAAQVAMSLVLLVSAGLLVRSSLALQRGTNFDPQHVSLIRIRPEMLHYTPAQNEAVFRRVVERLRSLPEAESVTVIRGGEGLVWNWQNGRKLEIRLPNPGELRAESQPTIRYHDIGLNFFRTLGIPLLQGRDFNAQDRPGSPNVAIINETLARQLWPHTNAVGQTLLIRLERDQEQQPVQIVGVSANIQPPNATQAPEPYLYLAFWQMNPGREGDLRLAIRVHGDPVAQLSAIRKAIQSVDPAIPMGEDMSMQQQMEMEYMPVMLSRTIVSSCGLLALCLSALGLYSVLTLAVRSRVRDIGVRMALGAQTSDVLKLVLHEGVSIGLAGAAIGLLAALATTRLLASWIYGVHSIDILSFAGGAALLIVTSILASYLPARRASQVDPLVALRQE
jgi:macrolide transport system ATP-binding/permease protein